MTAVFSYDAQTGPQYVDLIGLAAGYGVVSVPVTGFLPGDVVDMATLTIVGTGLTTIELAVDGVQRIGGYFAWTDPMSISAHFTLTASQVSAIAAATKCTYSVSVMVLRASAQEMREVQAGKASARVALPKPPLIVDTLTITGGPVTGIVGQQVQLTGTAKDANGNVVGDATIAWASGNTNIATVDATGLVTLIVPGVASITASCQGIVANTTATCSDPGFTGATDKEVSAYNAGQSKWLPTILTAAYLSIAAGALVIGGGWPGGATELAPGAAAGYVRSNGTAWARSSGVPAADVTPGTFGGNATYTIPNGLTVTTGTTALQTVTATTMTLSGTALAGQDAFIITKGCINVQDGDVAINGELRAQNKVVSIAGPWPTYDSTTVLVEMYGTGANGAGIVATGSMHELHFGIGVESTGTTYWYMDVNGHWLAEVDGRNDFGNNSKRARDIYASRNAFIGGTVNATTFVGALTGNASTATALQTPRTINGVSFDGTAPITITAAAGTLTGATLASNVVASSLTSVGILTGGTWTATVIGPVYGGTGQNAVVMGDLLYGSGPNVWSRLGGNVTATKQFLAQTGTGSVSAAPAWASITAADVGGGTFPAAVTFSHAVTFSDNGQALSVANSTTSVTYMQIQNLSGTFAYGVDSSAGGQLATGTAPYSGVLGVVGNLPVHVATNGAVRLTVTGAGSVIVGTAALATNASDGFFYIPTFNGTPTGTPTVAAGCVALGFDTSADKLWIYHGGWKTTTAFS